MTIFLAARTDGLGERLRSLLNAYEIARLRGEQFRVFWRPMYKGSHPSHAVQAMESTFSADFIGTHSVGRAIMGKQIINLKDWDATTESARQTDAIVSVDQIALATQAPEFFRQFGNRIDFASAFGSIAFHDDIKRAIEIAQGVDLNESCIGVHLRAGDIIYGDFRFSDRFHQKVVNLPIAEAYVERARAAGRDVVAFGQDRASLAYLASKGGVALAETIASGHGFTALQQAMFEIVLMSRRQELLAGTSGFAKVAAMIGGPTLVYERQFAPAQRYLHIVQDFLRRDPRDVPDLVKAFACRSACLALGEIVPERTEALALMQEASRLDPANPHYTALLAIHAYRAGDVQQAEQLLFGMINQPAIMLQPVTFFLTQRAVTQEFVCIAAHERLEEHASSGHPMAALCMAITRKANEDMERAEDFLHLYSTNCRDEWRSIGDSFLRRFGLDPVKS